MALAVKTIRKSIQHAYHDQETPYLRFEAIPSQFCENFIKIPKDVQKLNVASTYLSTGA